MTPKEIFWCGEGDLNPHEIAPASTSSYSSHAISRDYTHLRARENCVIEVIRVPCLAQMRHITVGSPMTGCYCLPGNTATKRGLPRRACRGDARHIGRQRVHPKTTEDRRRSTQWGPM